MYSIYLTPSFYAHIMNGLLLLLAFIVLCQNYSKIKKVEPYKLIILVLIFYPIIFYAPTIVIS